MKRWSYWISRASSVAVAGALVAGTVPPAALAILAEVAQAAPAAVVDTPPVPANPLALPSQPVVAGSKAGGLAGSADVTPGGAFTYSLALDVPAGRAGMTPELSLQYSSVGGNGPLGVGWKLAGVGSTITRCGQSLASEGVVTGVRFDQTDRFCLDGRKLVAVAGPQGSTYGGDGVHYRAEADGFVDVASRGSAATIASGPDTFSVTTRDGLLWTYLPHNATRVTSGVGFNPTPVEGDVSTATRRVIWLPAHVEDPSGNAMEWEYEESTGADGAEFLPKRIRYTSNSNGAQAHRYVEFEYLPRPDVTVSFQAGVAFRSTKRLSAVSMYAPNPVATLPVWKYLLDYVPPGTTASGRSLLASVRKCGVSGTCLLAKKFSWDPATAPAFATTPLGTQILNTAGSREPWMHVLDLDADGTDDLLYTLGGTNDGDSPVYARLGTRDGAGVASPLAELRMLTASVGAGFPANTSLPDSRPVDIDADGLTEFAAQYKDSAQVVHDKIIRWDAATKAFVDSGISLAVTPKWTDFADMNGDGRLDHLNANVKIGATTYYAVRLNTGGGFAPPTTTGFSAGCSGPRVGDLDGDGRAELLAKQVTQAGFCANFAHTLRLDANGTSYSIQPAASTVAGVTYHRAFPGFTTGYRVHRGDFNGDGLSDVAWVPPAGSGQTGRMLWNSGAGLRLDSRLVSLPPENADVRVADVNGDGRADLVAFDAKTTVWLSKGDGTFLQIVVAGDGGTNDPEAGRSTSQVGDFDGDGRVDIVRITNSQMSVLTHSSTGFEERMTAVTDEGSGYALEQVTYSRTWSDHPEHNTDHPSAYPLRSLRGGLVVVRKVTSRAHFVDSGPGNVAREMHFSYGDPVSDVRSGGGFLGFGTFSTWDPQRPAQTVTTYPHRTQRDGKRYPLAGAPDMVTTVVPILTQAQVGQAPPNAKARVTRTRYTPEYRSLGAAGARYAVLADLSTTKEWEQQVPIVWTALAGTPHVTHIGGLSEPNKAPKQFDTDVDIDNTGSITKTQRQSDGGVTETVTTEYEYRTSPDAGQLYPLPWKRSTTRSEADGSPGPVTRRVEYHYDWALRLDAAYIEKDNPDASLRQTTTYEFTELGSVRKVLTSASGLPAREARLEYQPVWPGQPAEEIHPSQTWSQHVPAAYRPSVWTAVHPAYGVAVATAAAVGVTPQGLVKTAASQAVYDEFGRPVKAMPAGGAVTETSYASRADGAGGTNGVLVTATTTYSPTSVTTSKTAVDRLGRTRHAVIDGFDGTDSTVTTGYDALGRAATVSRPYTGPVPGPATATLFDSLDRPVTATTPDGKTTGYAYPDLFTTETTGPTGQRSTVVADVDGRTASSSSRLVKPDGTAQEVTTEYGYAPFDLLHTVADDVGHVTTFDYDTLGRRVRVEEPDRGVSTSTYYGTGDVSTETHEGTAATTTFGYDDLGRQTSKQNSDGVSSFVFDLAANGLGQLAEAISPDGIRTSHRYDDLGRSVGLDYLDLSTNISYATDTGYDAAGRPEMLTYPDPDGAGPLPRLAVKSTYNGAGHLQRVDDVTQGQAAKLLWFVGTRRPDLSLATAQLGQAPSQVNVARTYYDESGRIKNLAATGAAGATLQNLTYTYYDNGLVKTRVQDDVAAKRSETFTHDTLDRLTGWQLQNGTSPAVSSKYGYDTIGNIYPQLATGNEDRVYGESDGSRPHALTMRDGAAGLESYHYDEKGRLVTTNAEDGSVTRAVTYTTFDLPRTVTKGGVTTTFAYDAFGTRVKETGPANAVFTVPGLYERRAGRNNTKHVHYLSSGDGSIGQTVTTVTNSGAATTATEFTLTDALGSTTATATGAGTLGQAFFYEPFGARVNADGTPSTAATGDISHGYTGHEHDPELGLINMKGRMYDPAMNRFLTPDPVVGDVNDGQSWNPYSYVRNTPLNLTDPTGYKWCEDRYQCEQHVAGIMDFFNASDAYSEGGVAGLEAYGRGWAEREMGEFDKRVANTINAIGKSKKPTHSDAAGKEDASGDNPDAEAQADTAIGIGGPVDDPDAKAMAATGHDQTAPPVESWTIPQEVTGDRSEGTAGLSTAEKVAIGIGLGVAVVGIALLTRGAGLAVMAGGGGTATAATGGATVAGGGAVTGGAVTGGAVSGNTLINILTVVGVIAATKAEVDANTRYVYMDEQAFRYTWAKSALPASSDYLIPVNGVTVTTVPPTVTAERAMRAQYGAPVSTEMVKYYVEIILLKGGPPEVPIGPDSRFIAIPGGSLPVGLIRGGPTPYGSWPKAGQE